MPIRPDSPCHERWGSFEARPGGRHCGACDVTVVDLTRVTRKHAEKLLKDAGGRLCGRLRVDTDGEPVFAPETKRAPGFLGVAVGLLAAACESPSDAPPEAPSVTAAPTLLVSTHTGGSLMSTEPLPMRPFADTDTTGVAVPIDPPAAVVEVDAIGVEDGAPTPDQILLTEAKEEREEARVTSRARRRHRTASVSSAARVHPLPPIPSSQVVPPPPTTLYLGGISYDP